MKRFGFFRRDYTSKLKKRIAKYISAEASRKGGGLESCQCIILYNQVVSELEKIRKWEKYIKFVISDDTSQDSSHALAALRIILKVLVEEFGHEMVMFLEDGATPQ